MAVVDIHIKGLRELARRLEEMKKGPSVPALNEWASRILEEAKSHVPSEQRQTIRLQFIAKESNEFDVKFHAPMAYLRFIKEAIKNSLGEMPITTKDVFKELLDQIENREAEAKG
jgi:hypothetical protein